MLAELSRESSTGYAEYVRLAGTSTTGDDGVDEDAESRGSERAVSRSSNSILNSRAKSRHVSLT